MLSPLSHVESHQPLRGLTRRVAHRRCTLQAVPFATGRRSRSAKEAREAARTALVSVHRFSSQASSCAPTRIPSAQVVRACSVSQQGALYIRRERIRCVAVPLQGLVGQRQRQGESRPLGARGGTTALGYGRPWWCLGCACAVVCVSRVRVCGCSRRLSTLMFVWRACASRPVCGVSGARCNHLHPPPTRGCRRLIILAVSFRCRPAEGPWHRLTSRHQPRLVFSVFLSTFACRVSGSTRQRIWEASEPPGHSPWSW